MSTKANYTAEEWKAISGAPVAAGLMLTLADASGPIGIVKEAMAVSRAITESGIANPPEIVTNLAQSVKSGTRPELPEIPTGDRSLMKLALMGVIKTAVRAVESKSPSEAQGYKTWLASVAAKAAQASREGGFLGFGGTLVSSDEEEALKQLADVLGTNPRRMVEPT